MSPLCREVPLYLSLFESPLGVVFLAHRLVLCVVLSGEAVCCHHVEEEAGEGLEETLQ